MKIWTIILLIFSILSAVALFRLSIQIDYYKVTKLHHDQNCKKVPIQLPSEDLVLFGDFVIGAAADYNTLFYKHLSAANASAGFLFAYNLKSEKIAKIKIKNFPEAYSFNPHGIDLLNNKSLYAISHSYSKGGECIFVIDLEYKNNTLSASFVKRIFLGPENGIYNSLHVISNQYFFISQSLSIPLSEQGRDLSFFTDLLSTLTNYLTQSNSLKLCLVLVDQVICSPRAHGYMPNGVAVLKDRLLLADSVTNTVNIYKVSQAYELDLQATVKFPHSVDNIKVINDIAYVAGIDRKIDFLNFNQKTTSNLPAEPVPSGCSKLLEISGKWVTEEVIMQDQLSLATAAVKSEKKIILSSFVDPALLVCEVN